MGLLYLHLHRRTCKTTRGIPVGSPIPSIIAEIYLQFFEEIFTKHWIENGGNIIS
jgi:hypothetical protein